MLYSLVKQVLESWWHLNQADLTLCLALAGFVFAALLSGLLLPRLWNYLPRDRGRAHAINAAASVGKPVGAGSILMGVMILSSLLFIPYSFKVYCLLPVIAAASLVGFIDDKTGGLSEMTLGLSDMVLALAGSLVIFGLEPVTLWMPFSTKTFVSPAWMTIPTATMLIWVSINALNCNDGVDGLSGSLATVTFCVTGCLFYSVLGNERHAASFLIPYNPESASWTAVCAVVLGTLFGYLRHNLPPAKVLMGDAGSRPLGFLIGVLAVSSKNPALIVFFAFTILLNGMTGIVKVVLLRFFKIHILQQIRFPVHDHARKNLRWTNTQVLVRFVSVHLVLTTILFVVLLKAR